MDLSFHVVLPPPSRDEPVGRQIFCKASGKLSSQDLTLCRMYIIIAAGALRIGAVREPSNHAAIYFLIYRVIHCNYNLLLAPLSAISLHETTLKEANSPYLASEILGPTCQVHLV